MSIIPESAIDAAEKIISKRPWPNRTTLEKAILAALPHLSEPVAYTRLYDDGRRIDREWWPSFKADGKAPAGAGWVPLCLVPLAPAADPVAVRYDWDGYGYSYADDASGSDWLTRYPDAEPLCVVQPKPVPTSISRQPICIDRTKTQLAEALRASDQSNHDMLHLVASMIGAIKSASPKLADRFQALADAAFEKWPRTETAEALAAFEKEKEHG